MNQPEYLALYDEQYFAGRTALSSYGDYSECRDILYMWAAMLDRAFKPKRVLDVGAAYGFVVDWFNRVGVDADGIEPSPWALSQKVTERVFYGWLPDNLDLVRSYDLVTCTECLEHLPTDTVPASLSALRAATKPGGTIVLLIMLAGHPTAHEDAGHLTLESRDWWEVRLDEAGLVPDRKAEERLTAHPMSEHMKWSGRIFVRKRP